MKRKMDYDNPGSLVDRCNFKKKLSIKSRNELMNLLTDVAYCCEMSGKGYVNQFEDTIRHTIGYVYTE